MLYSGDGDGGWSISPQCCSVLVDVAISVVIVVVIDVLQVFKCFPKIEFGRTLLPSTSATITERI